jgi:hypothetical protein
MNFQSTFSDSLKVQQAFVVEFAELWCSEFSGFSVSLLKITTMGQEWWFHGNDHSHGHLSLN